MTLKQNSKRHSDPKQNEANGNIQTKLLPDFTKNIAT